MHSVQYLVLNHAGVSKEMHGAHFSELPPSMGVTGEREVLQVPEHVRDVFKGRASCKGMVVGFENGLRRLRGGDDQRRPQAPVHEHDGAVLLRQLAQAVVRACSQVRERAQQRPPSRAGRVPHPLAEKLPPCEPNANHRGENHENPP